MNTTSMSAGSLPVLWSGCVSGRLLGQGSLVEDVRLPVVP